MTYDVQYFIDKFEKIPDEKWLTSKFRNNQNQRCAYGWCGSSDSKGDTEEGEALGQLFRHSAVSVINDGSDPKYQQPTPKARILAALKDLL